MRRTGTAMIVSARLDPMTTPSPLPVTGAWLPGDEPGHRQFFTFATDRRFALDCGVALSDVVVAYETWGRLDADGSNAILLCHAWTGDSHAAGPSGRGHPAPGWWDDSVGPGKPIDTDKNFVICVNSLGSCKGSTGPGSINPKTGRQYRLSFPDLVIEDIATAAKLVLDALEIEQLRAMVGPSMGGMSCLAMLRKYPDLTRHFLVICSAARAEPFAIAVRSLQREMIVRDPNWQDGAYTDECWPETGMRLARKLGMISYRSKEEWRERFGRDVQEHYNKRLFGMHFAVESYLENAAKKFIRNFDPCSYLYLSRAMDWFDVADGYDDLPSALAGINLKTSCVIGVETDILFPAYQQKEIADAIRSNGIDTSFTNLESLMGHDAFLVDHAHFNPHVTAYFERSWFDDKLQE